MVETRGIGISQQAVRKLVRSTQGVPFQLAIAHDREGNGNSEDRNRTLHRMSNCTRQNNLHFEGSIQFPCMMPRRAAPDISNQMNGGSFSCFYMLRSNWSKRPKAIVGWTACSLPLGQKGTADQIAMTGFEGALLGMGNPLLDIISDVDQAFLDKYKAS